MDARSNSSDYKTLRRHIKKHIVYDYDDVSDWNNLLRSFKESTLDINQKIKCLVDAASKNDISNFKCYGKLAAIVALECKTLQELLSTIKSVKINNFTNQNKYSENEVQGVIKSFYKALFKHASEMNLTAKGILQFFNYKEGDSSITDILKQYASLDHDIWWDYLNLLKKALKEDKSTASDVYNLLVDRSANTIAYQTKKHKDLKLIYLSILNRLHRSGISDGEIIKLLVTQGANSKRVFADYVFMKSDEPVKRSYLLFIKKLEQSCLDFKDGTVLPLYGIYFGGIKKVLILVDTLLRYGISHKIIFNILENKRNTLGFAEELYQFYGYTPVNRLFEIVNELLGKSRNAEKYLDIFNPAELIGEYGVKGGSIKKQLSIVDQTFQYYHDLLDMSVSAHNVFDRLKNSIYSLLSRVISVDEGAKLDSNCFILLNRLIKLGVDAEDVLDSMKIGEMDFTKYGRSFIPKWIPFVINLCNKTSTKVKVMDLLFSDDSNFLKVIIKRHKSIAGQVFYQLLKEDLMPPARHSSEMRDLVFAYIQTLGDDERRNAYKHIKSKTHPLAVLFWKQNQFLFLKFEPTLPRAVADKIKQETGSLKPEIIDETPALTQNTTYRLLDQSEHNSVNQPLLETSVELTPVYLPAKESKIYDELENLPSPPISQRLFSRNERQKQQESRLEVKRESAPMLF